MVRHRAISCVACFGVLTGLYFRFAHEPPEVADSVKVASAARLATDRAKDTKHETSSPTTSTTTSPIITTEKAVEIQSDITPCFGLEDRPEADTPKRCMATCRDDPCCLEWQWRAQVGCQAGFCRPAVGGKGGRAPGPEGGWKGGKMVDDFFYKPEAIMDAPQETAKPLVYIHTTQQITGTLLSKGCFSTKQIYGKAVCKENFCRHELKQHHMTMQGGKLKEETYTYPYEFDQFALERLLLGKWVASPLRCRESMRWCKENADIIISPSLHLNLFLIHGFYWWIQFGDLFSAYKRYWQDLHDTFFKPGRRAPIIVVHLPFTWDVPGSISLLRALSMQPSSFIGRVVLVGIESNLKGVETELFPKEWSANTPREIVRRATQREARDSPNGPLLVSMPYPTSILYTAGSLAYYDNQRRIVITLAGSIDKGADDKNWIRPMMTEKVRLQGGMYHKDLSVVCADPSQRFYDKEAVRHSLSGKGKTPSKGAQRGKTSFCGFGEKPTMWDVVLHSVFCVEPAGDTPTRSHLYISILAGCIPVIFDGGLPSYNTPTNWAWRAFNSSKDLQPRPSTEEQKLPIDLQDVFVDYKTFAVVYDAETVYSRKVDVLSELLDMYEKKPGQVVALQKRLKAVAPRMRYALEDNGNRDAFSALQSIVSWEAEWN